ncbi:MAG: enoyl-CoA hydratase-related protein [Bacteroidota bacterium]|nr:enoyl-CoA hydratase-related protein [Bacteroidota bacterium]
MKFENLILEEKDNVLFVTISRPKAMNALNTRFFHEMDEVVANHANKENLRAMVITGDGKAFVAGADIAEMVDKNSQEGTEFSVLGQNTFASLEKLEIPVIAAINGFALGGGLELAMACDFRIASTKAKFGQPEVSLGLTPGYAGTQRLPRLVGLADALYLLLTADMIDAATALRIGLVQKVVEPEELMETVTKIAKTIASKGPLAIKKVKMVTRQGLLSGFDAGCNLEAENFGSLFGNEGTVGMKAFMEKRKPEW